MSVQIGVLEKFGREVELRKKWMKIWDKLGKEILRLPEWMQNIVLEDVNTAVKNRLATMEMIQNAKRNPRT
jgi:hypothetical protein